MAVTTRRALAFTARLPIVGAWAVFVLSLDRFTSDVDVQFALAFGGCVAAGFLIGRLWALGVPLIAVVGAAVYGGLAGCSGDCRYETGVMGGLILVLLYIGVAETGVGIGLGLRRLVRARGSRSSTHRALV
jgi:hypothetical protein